jgi:hypothetical protein
MIHGKPLADFGGKTERRPMAMFLKMMGTEDLPDRHGDKSYTIVGCKSVQFSRTPDGAFALIDEVKQFRLEGNAYVLSDTGKTLDSFALHGEVSAPVPIPV